jgi:hypothetical protein
MMCLDDDFFNAVRSVLFDEGIFDTHSNFICGGPWTGILRKRDEVDALVYVVVLISYPEGRMEDFKSRERAVELLLFPFDL